MATNRSVLGFHLISILTAVSCWTLATQGQTGPSQKKKMRSTTQAQRETAAARRDKGKVKRVSKRFAGIDPKKNSLNSPLATVASGPVATMTPGASPSYF